MMMTIILGVLAAWLISAVALATLHKIEGTPWTWPRAFVEWLPWPWLAARAVWRAVSGAGR